MTDDLTNRETVARRILDAEVAAILDEPDAAPASSAESAVTDGGWTGAVFSSRILLVTIGLAALVVLAVVLLLPGGGWAWLVFAAGLLYLATGAIAWCIGSLTSRRESLSPSDTARLQALGLRDPARALNRRLEVRSAAVASDGTIRSADISPQTDPTKGALN